MKILAVGPIWRGSNAGGLFKALSRNGCIIDVVDEFYHISLNAGDTATKAVHKLIRPLQVKDYNNAIVRSLNVFKPEVFFVYKGAFVYPETVQYAKRLGCRLALFYPDVSMMAHGKYLPKTVPLYEVVFTTKTFGIRDLKEKFGIGNAHFIPHGFDPEVHRKLTIRDVDKATFGCDVSFIGTYSEKKEKYLSDLKRNLPETDLKIWGTQWEKSTDPVIKQSLQNLAVFGDLYAMAIQCSKINLGILHEQVLGASSGDLITSRTFHIPGAGGFLMHERNAESVQYFAEETEAAFFDGSDELVQQVRRYLQDDALRNKVKEAGYARAQKDHSLDKRAAYVIDILNSTNA